MVNQKKLAKKIRNKQDKEWRLACKKRDGGLCVVCLSYGKNNMNRINCHHILSRGIKEFRHDVMNGICLCPLHHKWGTFSAHKNSLWFYRWFSQNRFEQLDYLLRNCPDEPKEIVDDTYQPSN